MDRYVSDFGVTNVYQVEPGTVVTVYAGTPYEAEVRVSDDTAALDGSKIYVTPNAFEKLNEAIKKKAT